MALPPDFLPRKNCSKETNTEVEHVEYADINVILPQDAEVKGQAQWQDYPFNLTSYNPLAEWGSHYAPILDRDYYSKVSNFDVLEMSGNEIEERRVSGTIAVDQMLQHDPDFRIIYCDSRLCADGVTRGSLAADDIKKILTKYNISLIFLDYFVGRNRPTNGSRKIHNPEDPSEILFYDVWYILPSRIYGDENEYDCHFILFTLYIHYDCRTKKTFVFCIHRLGTENQLSAERSSAQIKLRMCDAIQRISLNPSHTQLKDNPFALQLPTITSSVVLWTEALHTERLSMWEREDRGREDLSTIDTAALHNVSRYIHSYKTNILFTLRVLVFLRNEHTWFARRLGGILGYGVDDPAYSMVEDTLDSQVWQMEMISTYADEVVKRTQILIEIYFNRISETDSDATAAIAEETRRDAISMRTIAFVTLIFLPATFVAAFFSMAFFQTGGPFEVMQLWLYPVVVVPTTTIVLAAWWAWHKRFQRRTQVAFDIEGRKEKQRRLSRTA